MNSMVTVGGQWRRASGQTPANCAAARPPTIRHGTVPSAMAW
ncbi:hypothetical protein ACH4U7_21510 [Streptomyces sp. NPDC020845]